jgi:uncharacterized phage-associated protein
MTIPVDNVAKFIVQNSDRVSNLKLQKLLYYAQGWHLGLRGTPLFAEDLEAWAHGPVVPEMFREYRVYRWQTIMKPTDPIEIPLSEANHIKSVLRAYGRYAADQLERLSHSEAPWKIARNGLPDGESSNAVISHESMREFFASRARS